MMRQNQKPKRVLQFHLRSDQSRLPRAAAAVNGNGSLHRGGEVVSLFPFEPSEEKPHVSFSDQLFILIGLTSDLRMAWRGGRIEFFKSQLDHTYAFAIRHEMDKTRALLERINASYLNADPALIFGLLDQIEMLVERTIDAVQAAGAFA